jgi:maltose O-acetyltransferase
MSLMFRIYNFFISSFPFFGNKIRVIFLSLCGVKFGKNVVIEEGVKFLGYGHGIKIGSRTILKNGVTIQCKNGNIIIGDDCEFNYGDLIAANHGSNIIIGDNVAVAHYVCIKGSTHIAQYIEDLHTVHNKSVFLDIRIGSGSWLCAGCIINPGVSLGKNNVVASGAVVINDTQDNVLMAGVPAEVKKIYGNGG